MCIELFAEYWYWFSNCCLECCVMERFSTAQRVFVETFYENGDYATQNAMQ